MLRVAVDAKGQLGEVIGADRKAVKALGEVRGQNDVRGDFAHDIDFKAILAALEAVLRHNAKDTVGLPGRPAEGDHDDDVREAEIVA